MTDEEYRRCQYVRLGYALTVFLVLAAVVLAVDGEWFNAAGVLFVGAGSVFVAVRRLEGRRS